MLFQQPGKVFLSLFYDVMRGKSPTNTQRIKGAWERELSVTIDEETWQDIGRYTNKILKQKQLHLELYIEYI